MRHSCVHVGLEVKLYPVLFSGDRSEPVSAEVSFYSRGGSIPCSLKAHITATYLTNTGEYSMQPVATLLHTGVTHEELVGSVG